MKNRLNLWKITRNAIKKLVLAPKKNSSYLVNPDNLPNESKDSCKKNTNQKREACNKLTMQKNNWVHKFCIRRQTLRTKYQEHQGLDIFQLIFHIFLELSRVPPLQFWQQYSLLHISFQQYTKLVYDDPTIIVYLYTNLLCLLANDYISAAEAYKSIVVPVHNGMSR
jgi:hypothetical protein